MSAVYKRLKDAVSRIPSDYVKTVAGIGLPIAFAYGVMRYLHYRASLPSPPAPDAPAPRVSQLWIYPIKSCGGMRVSSAKLLPGGFEYDRNWALINADFVDDESVNQMPQVVTLRDIPKMKLVTAVIDDATKTMRVTLGTEKDAIVIPLAEPSADKSREAKEVALWGIKGRVVSEGEDAARKLSAFLGANVYLGRIVGFRDPRECSMDGNTARDGDVAKLHDFSALHLCTEEGLKYLQRGVPKQNITVQRFRPNIVVQGTVYPEENTWVEFQIGAVAIRTAKLCGRCSVPTVNDDLKKDPQFLPTAFLKKHRAVKQSHREKEDLRVAEPIFGISCFAVDPKTVATIRVGDAVKNITLRRVQYETAITFA